MSNLRSQKIGPSYIKFEINNLNVIIIDDVCSVMSVAVGSRSEEEVG